MDSAYKNEQSFAVDSGNTSKYQLSRFRYVNLSIYLFTALANSLPAQTFSSMNSLVEQKFQISAILVTLNALIFPIMHPIAAFPSGWVIDKFGMKVGCCIGGVAVILGTWLRYTIDVGQPWLCLLGSVLAAFGNVFILNSSSLMAVNWFQSQLVPKIIMVCVLVNFLSAALGATVAGWFLSSSSSVQDVRNFLKWEALAITIPYAIFIILFRERPRHPPSQSAQLSSSQGQKRNYIQTLKSLIKNPQYIKVGIAAAFSFGAIISLFSILNQCLKVLGYKNPGQITSLTITSLMVTSVFSIILFSHWVQKTKQYKKIITICTNITQFILQAYQGV